MGKRGPKPLPSKVLAMRGSWRAAGRAATELQVQALEKLPPPPGFLGAIAQQEWYRVGPCLVVDRLLAERDLAAFTSYCIACGRVAQCEMELNLAASLTVATVNGFLQPHPLVAMARHARAEVRQFSQEFGLTPSARVKVRPPDAKPVKAANPWDETKSG